MALDDGAQGRLSGEDLTFWWADSPALSTTMAMLLILDRMPPWVRLRHAVERAVSAVPRLRQRVVDAPFDLTLPHWTLDSTFDLDYHLRRHALGARTMSPSSCARSHRRTRPPRPLAALWEARVYEGLADGRAALFFKLHHAVADGIGGNAIFAAMTDFDAEETARGRRCGYSGEGSMGSGRRPSASCRRGAARPGRARGGARGVWAAR
jgi:hypothetical protein